MRVLNSNWILTISCPTWARFVTASEVRWFWHRAIQSLLPRTCQIFLKSSTRHIGWSKLEANTFDEFLLAKCYWLLIHIYTVYLSSVLLLHLCCKSWSSYAFLRAASLNVPHVFPGGIRCSSSFWACKGAETAAVEAVDCWDVFETWQVQNGFEDLRSDHQVMKALLFLRKHFISWSPLLCNAQISQMELKELSVMALESRKLMQFFSSCTLYMGASWNLQSSNPHWLEFWQRPQHITRTASLLTRWRRTPALKDGRKQTL